MFDRRLLLNFDWTLLITVSALALIGTASLHSATSGWMGGGTPLYLKQLSWFGIGLFLALLICCFDYRHLEHLGSHFFVINLALLVAVLFFGKKTMGATRWLDLGLFNLQPSEVMKVVIIIAFARYFSRHGHFRGHRLRELAIPFALLVLPVVLVLKQPDLGTSLLILFIAVVMVLFAGISRGVLVFLVLLAILGAGGGWFMLHDYQKERIYTFLNPERDPLGSGYHIIQSKIAIGSGGTLGKGFMQGTQSQLSFLPERHTDFAFSVFAEEWGFAGCLVLLLLYLFLVMWGISIARRAADRFGMLLAVGVTAMFFWHIVINLGMVIGLLPVVGVPLPLFSYGGTSMVTTMIGTGLLLNVSMRRFMF